MDIVTTVTPEVINAVAGPDNSMIISQALQITGLGMLILFASLLILWGVMELLVRYVQDSPEAEDSADSDEVVAAAETDDSALKAKVAAAAAGYVLAKKK